jgi:lysophospholipase L1-like esterase
MARIGIPRTDLTPPRRGAAGQRALLWRDLAFWSLLPVCAPQGFMLRRRAARLPPAAGPDTGTCGSGPGLHLLAAGDSIIAGVGAARREQTLAVQFAQALSATLGQGVAWRCEGASGANLGGLLQRLQLLDADTQADVILLSIGVNDVTGLATIGRWRAQLRQLMALIRRRWPAAWVVFAGLPPMEQFPLLPQPLRFSLGLRARTFDGIAAGLVGEQAAMLHVPTRVQRGPRGFCADGFHPCSESYAIWGRELARRLLAVRGR